MDTIDLSLVGGPNFVRRESRGYGLDASTNTNAPGTLDSIAKVESTHELSEKRRSIEFQKTKARIMPDFNAIQYSRERFQPPRCEAAQSISKVGEPS